MKELTKHSFRYLCGFILLSFLFASCNDDDESSTDDGPAGSGLPQVLTIPASKISQFKALGTGAVVSKGGSEIIGRGLMWSDSANVTLENAAVVTNQGTNIGVFTAEIDKLSDLELGLDSNTTYFVKAYAENSQGIGYGEELSFTTMENFYVEGEPVMDVDGNTYRTVVYEKDGMTWMGENLKTTSYKNGDPIPYVAEYYEWDTASTSAYCFYENDSSYIEEYGNLYNFYTVEDPRGLCPAGWHVPTNLEWAQLEGHIDDYSSGSGLSGDQLKETGTEYWSQSLSSVTNFSGFSARGGGLRATSLFEDFARIKQSGNFWSSTETSDPWEEDGVLVTFINDQQEFIWRSVTPKRPFGHSVRCIKDE